MSFYDCKYAIAERLGECLEIILAKKGLNTKYLVDQHKALIDSVNDPYSRALLVKDLPQDFPPLFYNVPRPYFREIIRDNFEQTFEALGFPTTQQQAARFERNIRHRSARDTLNNHQEESLLKTEFVVKEFLKVSDWCVKANKIVKGMNARLELLKHVVEQEREFARSLVFDWHYDYSDDGNVSRAGSAKHSAVCKHVREVLAVKPHLRKVIDEVASANHLDPKFFIEC